MFGFLNIFKGEDATEIIPNLWLGNYKAALDANFLSSKKINLIINCTKNLPFYYQVESCTQLCIETYRIPVNDNHLEIDFITMEKYLKIVIPLLVKKYVDEKKNILIHCRAGKQRSAIVVAAFLKVLSDTCDTHVTDTHVIRIKSRDTCDTRDQFKNIYFKLYPE